MKIDVSKIDGYAEMTAEQKLAALEAIDVPDPVDISEYVKKDVADKYASEAAANKKVASESKDVVSKLTERIGELETINQISEHRARFSELGYDAALADATAKALASGDMTTVFANQKKFLEIKEKAIKADVLKGTPAPGGAGGGGDEKPANVEMAKAMGAQKAATLKAANEGLKNYL